MIIFLMLENFRHCRKFDPATLEREPDSDVCLALFGDKIRLVQLTSHYGARSHVPHRLVSRRTVPLKRCGFLQDEGEIQ